ncbi:DUF7482 domain-containing protein [Candidatus Nitrosarchaeum limnium]|uniref:DUF7482 domain-containing protein n=1 Tax=Candidatus Nitrosarchaeum limnium BG20 TaxID=859192 RepID=S2EUW0_9ARCH|nr:hypothetical protein [Candidatus Nitrosarchaeum limnium]EPA06064.1 hypothetical protein BG20_I0587 [Candidatus Nitrosarchaeum limnium BG20]
MNTTLKTLAILAILPVFTVALSQSYLTDADALKAQGVGVASYGSANAGIVCGDRLCSEVSSKYVEKQMTEQKMEEKQMKDKAMMEEKHAMAYKMTQSVDAGSVLKLSRANVPATIPLHQGYHDGGNVYYIITDSSDQTHADTISKNQKWKVELAPLLKNAPAKALSKAYMFTNGISGDGVHKFQGEVFTSTPAQPDVYSALTSHVHVTWKDGATPRILNSEKAILDAEKKGELTLTPVQVVLNMPQIVWPDGQMMVKKDKTLADDTPYVGGQVLNIDTKEKTVTFIAHRGWGPDGRTIYYIVTDATPSGPAEMMGVTNAPRDANLIANSAAVDIYQFTNGIKGSGPLGFQAGIASGALGDENYSPMWRINVIGWKDPANAALLENISDINAYKNAGKIDISLARPMNSDHIVNCPFIDPFQ